MRESPRPGVLGGGNGWAAAVTLFSFYFYWGRASPAFSALGLGGEAAQCLPSPSLEPHASRYACVLGLKPTASWGAEVMHSVSMEVSPDEAHLLVEVVTSLPPPPPPPPAGGRGGRRRRQKLPDWISWGVNSAGGGGGGMVGAFAVVGVGAGDGDVAVYEMSGYRPTDVVRLPADQQSQLRGAEVERTHLSPSSCSSSSADAHTDDTCRGDADETGEDNEVFRLRFAWPLAGLSMTHRDGVVQEGGSRSTGNPSSDAGSGGAVREVRGGGLLPGEGKAALTMLWAYGSGEFGYHDAYGTYLFDLNSLNSSSPAVDVT